MQSDGSICGRYEVMNAHSGTVDVLLINPPYVTITSSRGVGHQVPLGMLMVGGALLDAGVRVELLDAECQHLSVEQITAHVRRISPRIVMTGHAGSTPAHPACCRMLRAIKDACPQAVTVYGGVYPTYHAREILQQERAVDVIVRGEGEATAVELVQAILGGRDLGGVRAIAFRAPTATDKTEQIIIGDERPPIDMNDYRIGWELIDHGNPLGWDAYQCFGLGRAAIVQFSRGCPHACTYCGQHGFWMKWRHRDPAALAKEIEWLTTEKQVRFITLADENPTTLKSEWRRFLEELSDRRTGVKFFSTIRASDIVRDADILRLYKSAGIQYNIKGIDATDHETLQEVKKGSTARVDHEACRLLREHRIFSIIAHIVGLGKERLGDFVQVARQLSLYDGDYLNAMYATPHAWTVFGYESRRRVAIEQDLSRWDYRHQVLATEYLRPWQLFAAVKLLELAFHLRPRRLRRLLFQDGFSRSQSFWNLGHTGAVWGAEIGDFILRRASRRGKRTLSEFYGGAAIGPSRHEERLVSLRIERRRGAGPAGFSGESRPGIAATGCEIKKASFFL